MNEERLNELERRLASAESKLRRVQDALESQASNEMRDALLRALGDEH